MKVLQVINSLHTGGAEKLLLEAIPLYNKKGIKMDLLLLNGTEAPFLKALKKQKCCNIFSLGNGTVYNPLLIFKIMPFLKNYDVAHVHLFPAQYFVPLAKLISFSKIKLIFTEHSTNNRRIENSIFRWIDKFSYRFYKKIICITKEVFNIIKKHTGLPKHRFEIIENGVNLNAIIGITAINKNEINPAIRDEDIIVTQVSSFQEPKDQPALIKALIHLPKTVKLIFVGDGVLRNECERLVKELNLETRVFFLGIRTDVPQLLKSSDIVVLSSKYEGLSLSSIEGMASGKPFIASDVPGLNDIVNGAGLLFPVGDEIVLAKHIIELLNNESYYNEVAERCLERAEKYSINIMVAKHLNLYKALYNEET